jgi:hypothetical protein
LEIIPRPDAPYELDDEQSDIWRSIVNSMPADHFQPANFHLLAKLCKHIATGRRMDQLVESETRKRKIDDGKLARLQKMRHIETTAIVMLSRSMRLTQQSIWLPQVAGNRIKGVAARKVNLIDAPWNNEDDDGHEPGEE